MHIVDFINKKYCLHFCLHALLCIYFSRWIVTLNTAPCYIDTDSFVYDVRTNDILTHFYIQVLRIMKDEYNGKMIREFIGLRAKILKYTPATLLQIIN